MRRRVFKPRADVVPASREPAACLNCGTPLTGAHCTACGQASDVDLLSMKEVAGDVTHSLLHLDSRVSAHAAPARAEARRTHARVHLRARPTLPAAIPTLSAVSILFFALSALLPDSNS